MFYIPRDKEDKTGLRSSLRSEMLRSPDKINREGAKSEGKKKSESNHGKS